VLETIHKKTVVTFGELLLRLTTKGHERFAQAESFEARYTGAEANVAVSLANWGMAALAVSKVPDHEIGQACINYLRRFGVNTDYVYRGGRRLGIVFAEIGASQRPSQIIYDRAFRRQIQRNSVGRKSFRKKIGFIFPEPLLQGGRTSYALFIMPFLWPRRTVSPSAAT
jgi:sugar/nucleoside kinase (ribokinase family)